MDCATVPVVFVGESGEQVYSLDWTELLTVAGDSPFQSVDDLSPGTKVMAPWCDKTNHSVVQYSEATVVEGGLTGVFKTLYFLYTNENNERAYLAHARNCAPKHLPQIDRTPCSLGVKVHNGHAAQFVSLSERYNNYRRC